MTTAEKKKLVQLLVKTLAGYGEEPTRLRVQALAEGLARNGIGFHTASYLINNHLSSQYGTAKITVANLLAEMRKKLEDPAEQALRIARRNIMVVGSSCEEITFSDRVIALTIQRMGGWVRLCHGFPEEQEERFIQTYIDLSMEGHHTQRTLPVLRGTGALRGPNRRKFATELPDAEILRVLRRERPADRPVRALDERGRGDRRDRSGEVEKGLRALTDSTRWPGA